MEVMQRMSSYFSYSIGIFRSSWWRVLALQYESFTKKTNRGEQSDRNIRKAELPLRIASLLPLIVALTISSAFSSHLINATNQKLARVSQGNGGFIPFRAFVTYSGGN